MTVCVKEIEVEVKLLTDFDKAANQNHKPGDQVITDFMRDYVDRAKEQCRQLRKEAVEYANASMRLEGFELSEKDHKLGKLYIEGQIDTEGLRDGHDSRER